MASGVTPAISRLYGASHKNARRPATGQRLRRPCRPPGRRATTLQTASAVATLGEHEVASFARGDAPSNLLGGVHGGGGRATLRWRRAVLGDTPQKRSILWETRTVAFFMRTLHRSSTSARHSLFVPAAALLYPPLHTLPTVPRDEERRGETRRGREQEWRLETRDERRETRDEREEYSDSADFAFHCLSLPFHCLFHCFSLALHCLSTPQVLGSFAMMGDDAAAMSPRPLQACDPFDGWALPEVD